MTRAIAVVLFGLGVTGVAFSAAEPKQPFEVTTTERVNFPPGGAIRFENSYGYLTIEGWDEPAVEITVTKSTDWFDEPGHTNKAQARFEQVRVVTNRPSDKELTISTHLPVRDSLFTSVVPAGGTIVTLPLPPKTKRGITVEYRVHVPRDSRLTVRQDNGYVWVSGVSGDLELHSHTGDMIVALTDPGPWSVDALTRLGSIAADVSGAGRKSFLVGSHFVHSEPSPSQRVHLRMGRGSITVKSGSPSP